ncbi:MAG: hypothetical protein ACK45B_00525 [Limisphaerales bacterium]
MNALAKTTFAVTLALATTLTARAGYIYDNSQNDLVQRLQAVEGLWFGDEINLAGTDRFMIGFDFQFWATNTTGLTIDVELRLQDGPLFNGYASPGTLIYSYYGFSAPNTPRSTLVFDSTDLSGGIDLTGVNTLTLAVRFTNIGSGEAGVDIYDPPVVGSSFDDYWQYIGGSWQLTTNNVIPKVNFAMRIDAIPEPTALSLVLLGGLAGLVGRRLIRR